MVVQPIYHTKFKVCEIRWDNKYNKQVLHDNGSFQNRIDQNWERIWINHNNKYETCEIGWYIIYDLAYDNNPMLPKSSRNEFLQLSRKIQNTYLKYFII